MNYNNIEHNETALYLFYSFVGVCVENFSVIQSKPAKSNLQIEKRYKDICIRRPEIGMYIHIIK